MAIFNAKYNIGDCFYYIEREKVKKADITAVLFEKDCSINYRLKTPDGDQEWLSNFPFTVYSSTEELIDAIKIECEKYKDK